MTDLIARYGAEIFEYNNISAARRRQQPIAIRGFQSWLADEHELDLPAARGDHLQTYLAIRLHSVAGPTVRKELNMIRPFYAWLWRKKLVTAEQMLELRDVKAPRGSAVSVPRPYNAKQIGAFWADLETSFPWVDPRWIRPRDPLRAEPLDCAEWFVERYFRGTSHWPRVVDYARRLQIEAIVALALYGGLRQNEIFRLEVDQIHPDNRYVVVMSARKNAEGVHVARVVPWVVPQMREAVDHWLTFRKRISPDHNGAWLSLRPSQYALKSMGQGTFDMLLTKTGRGWQMHRLRHTAATEMLRSGMALEIVQRIMGHATINQTLAYAKLVEDDIVRGARRGEDQLAKRMTYLRYPQALTWQEAA